MLIAIDCDLRQSYCVSETGWAGRGPTPIDAIRGAPTGALLVLFEIASPVSFNRGASGHAAMTQLAKWAIWNTAMAERMNSWLYPHKMLVAPSNVWTRGYDLKTRHAVAQCKQPKKDLRECEAMLWFHAQRPGDWKPLQDYLAAL